MHVDIFDPTIPSQVLAFHEGTQSLTAIIDGSGSWGSGREAADLARDLLASRWLGARDWSTAKIASDLSEVASSTPLALRDAEFGWSFSATCLLCTDDLLECVAAGFYRVDVFDSSGSSTLFRPRMLIDQLLAEGTLGPEDLAAFPHREIVLGPFVGDRDQVDLTTVRHTIAQGQLVIVTHQARYDFSSLSLPISAQALAAMAKPDSYPSPVVVIGR